MKKDISVKIRPLGSDSQWLFLNNLDELIKYFEENFPDEEYMNWEVKLMTGVPENITEFQGF